MKVFLSFRLWRYELSEEAFYLAYWQQFVSHHTSITQVIITLIKGVQAMLQPIMKTMMGEEEGAAVMKMVMV